MIEGVNEFHEHNSSDSDMTRLSAEWLAARAHQEAQRSSAEVAETPLPAACHHINAFLTSVVNLDSDGAIINEMDQYRRAKHLSRVLDSSIDREALAGSATDFIEEFAQTMRRLPPKLLGPTWHDEAVVAQMELWLLADESP